MMPSTSSFPNPVGLLDPHRAKVPHPVTQPPTLSSALTPELGGGRDTLLVYIS